MATCVYHSSQEQSHLLNLDTTSLYTTQSRVCIETAGDSCIRETFVRGADKQELRLIIVAVLQRGVSWRKKRNMRMERERDGLGYGGHLVMVFTRG